MKKILLSLTAFLLITCLLNAGTIEKTYHFSNPKVSEASGYQIISFENTLLTGLAGEPALPYQSVALLLPAGCSANNIEIITGNEIILDGTYQIYPQQHAQPLSKGGSGVFVKNEALYLSDVSYPASQVGELSTQFMNGFAVAMSAFTPLKYNPATGKVSYYETVTIVVKTISDLKSSKALQNINTSKDVQKRLSDLVQNSEMISTYPTRDNRTDDYDMIIVTPSQFEASFAPLISFYAVRGLIVKVATTQYIYSTMTGQDNPAKIRNYFIQEYQNHGVQHVFLGGDVEHVPYRGFYCHVQSSSVYDDDDIPSDLYYSALDGNWNTDGDGKWGEIGEDDLLPELGVARFSFSSAAELTIMLHKTTMYQGSPILGELQKPLLAGEWLYDNPETWGSDYLELLIGNRTDNGYETTGIPVTDNIERLYDEDGTWSASTLRQKINSGKSFIHHVGHANTDYTMKMSNSDITNANFSQVNGIIHNFTLAYSHGCICGAFDASDCIAERMVNIDNFAVAVVMNSRYGWFNEGQTEGPSAHIHREFADAIYTKKENHIGMAHSISKMETAPWVNAPGQWEEGALRWCFYDCNVLGDAGMRIWTAEPISITANYQSALPIGVPSVSITVNGNGNYVEGFSCVFMKDGVNYGTGITNAAGQAEIVFTTPITNVGDATIYVSGYNCQVTEFPLTVIPNTGAFVVYASSTINDVNGNNNGIAEYTESIMLTSTMKNVGTVQADNVVVTLSSADPYVTITDNTENFGNIAGGATVTVENAFAFTIAANIPDQHAVGFTLLAVGQDSWSSDFSVTVSAPELGMANYVINDAVSGNNNGLLDPGETADMIVVIGNEGGAEAYEVMAGLVSNSIYVTVNNGTAQQLGDLNSGNTAQATFSISAAANIPAGYAAVLVAQIEAMYGIEASEEFTLLFSDYCEASTSTEDEYISKVVFGTINNSSGWQGAVANYTNLSTVMNAGGSQQMVVTNGTPWASDMVTVWVDWNRNYEFGDNANETFDLTNVGGTGASFQGNITVPNTQFGGQYRMRVRMTYSTAPTPCGSATYGEIEDYSLLVSGGAPLGVNVMCNPTEICVGNSSQMAANPTGGSGVYTFSWTPTTGLSNPNIYNPVASPTTTTTYTVQVNDGIQTISAQATLTVHDLPATPSITLNVLTLQSSAAEGNQWFNSQGIIPGANGQTYTCTTEDDYYVIVTSFFGCVSAPSNIITVEIPPVSSTYFQTIWTSPFQPMSIFVTKATIDNLNMVAGDEIGVFDIDPDSGNEICVGTGMLTAELTGGAFLEIIASMDDGTGATNGFQPGNEMIFKLYSPGAGLVDYLTVTFPYPGYDEVFAPLGTTVVEIEGISTIVQNIQLSTGWNLVSFRAFPENMNMLTIFDPVIVANQLTKVLDQDGNSIIHLPFPPPYGQWSNTIGDLTMEQGYYVKVTESTNLSIEGIPVVMPFEIPLRAGWNMISVPCAEAQSAEQMLQPLISSGKLIKVTNDAGQSIVHLPFPPPNGQWSFGFTSFVPSEGYYVKVNADCSLVFDCSVSDEMPANGIAQPQVLDYFQPVYQNNPFMPMTIALSVDPEIVDGDEIGIFDGETCVGASKSGSLIFVTLPVSMDDPETEAIDGFVQGNLVTARIWHHNTNVVEEAGLVYLEGSQTFQPLETYIGSIKTILTSINEVQTSDGVTFEINPNPLHGKAMMKYSIPEDGLVNIQILRIDGRLIKILSNEAKQAGEGVIGFDSEGFKPGSYLVKFYYKGRIEKTIIRKLFIY